jgi:hypothetical protein
MCGEFCTLPALFLKIIFNFSLSELLGSSCRWERSRFASPLLTKRLSLACGSVQEQRVDFEPPPFGL